MLSTLSTESEAWDSDGSYTVCVHGLGHGQLLPGVAESGEQYRKHQHLALIPMQIALGLEN